VERVQALEPQLVLLTGDLSALGDDEELAAVRQALEPFIASGRLVTIPGNHDRYTEHPRERRFERRFAAELKSDLPEHADERGYPFVKLVGEDLAVVGLDSTRVGAWSQYFVGRIGETQREALARILDDSRLHGRTVLLLSHHGPWGLERRFDWRESGLLDAGALLELLRERPVVLHHGHSHHRMWHRAGDGHPHVIGGGSSTQRGVEGCWLIEMDDHRHLEAREVLP
jgi:3',5'-cyclic AMP phosphodiesterase CpdA